MVLVFVAWPSIRGAWKPFLAHGNPVRLLIEIYSFTQFAINTYAQHHVLFIPKFRRDVAYVGKRKIRSAEQGAAGPVGVGTQHHMPTFPSAATAPAVMDFAVTCGRGWRDTRATLRCGAPAELYDNPKNTAYERSAGSCWGGLWPYYHKRCNRCPSRKCHGGDLGGREPARGCALRRLAIRSRTRASPQPYQPQETVYP